MGSGARPPEDVGGIWGYRDLFLPAIRNPRHPEHKSWLEWAGGRFDPSELDLKAANSRLDRLQRRVRQADVRDDSAEAG
jgi:hypothetical protein